MEAGRDTEPHQVVSERAQSGPTAGVLANSQSVEAPVGLGAVLFLQRRIGNRATSAYVQGAARMLARQQTAVDDVARLMRDNDWHGAAKTLAAQDAAAIEARVRALSSAQRQYLVEGARHGDITAVISAVDRFARRDAIIGSVRFFVWKHMWEQAGTYLCGLNDPDIRRVATQLGLTYSDLRAIEAAQPEPQKTRLSLAFYTDVEFVKKIPKDLVSKDPGGTVLAWLAADKLVGGYAAKKWKEGAKPRVQVIASDKWSAFYAQQQKGRINPETGKELTPEEAQHRSVESHGFTTAQDEIFLKQGENTPGSLIHEAIHALAPEKFDEELGRQVEEGTTEYFANRVARAAGKHPNTEYREQREGAAALAALVGDELLAECFFEGKILKLKFAVDDKKGEGTFDKWVAAMNDNEARKTAPALLR